MSDTLVIFNPRSGSVARHWPQAARALRDAGHDFEAVPTLGPKDAQRLARDRGSRCACVVAVGGDGLFHEVVSGLMTATEYPEAKLLLLPLGTGNDYVKALPPEAPVGGSGWGWPTAIEKFLRGQTMEVDVGRITLAGGMAGPEARVFHFLNGFSIGFAALGARWFRRVRRLGRVGYYVSAWLTLARYPSPRVRITSPDGVTWEQPTALAGCFNGRCFGGQFWIAPQASPSDGLFEVVAAGRLRRARIIRILRALREDGRVSDPAVNRHPAAQVTLESPDLLVAEADGESIPSARRYGIENLPQRLRIYA